MNRAFFTTPNICRNKCTYCFERFNSYRFPLLCWDSVKNLSDCIIYPTCNTEFVIDSYTKDFFADYILNATSFNIFSFSVKNNLSKQELDYLTSINTKMIEKGIGGIKVNISIASKSIISDLEPNTLSYNERLYLAKRIKEANIQCGLIIKPIMPYLSVDEYKNVVLDFFNIGINNVVLGDLYISSDSLLANDYDSSIEQVDWISKDTKWTKIRSANTTDILKSYIHSIGGVCFLSDREQTEFMFKNGGLKI